MDGMDQVISGDGTEGCLRDGMDQVISGAFRHSPWPRNFKECSPESNWGSTDLSYFYFHSVIASVANDFSEALLLCI